MTLNPFRKILEDETIHDGMFACKDGKRPLDSFKTSSLFLTIEIVALCCAFILIIALLFASPETFGFTPSSEGTAAETGKAPVSFVLQFKRGENASDFDSLQVKLKSNFEVLFDKPVKRFGISFLNAGYLKELHYKMQQASLDSKKLDFKQEDGIDQTRFLISSEGVSPGKRAFNYELKIEKGVITEEDQTYLVLPLFTSLIGQHGVVSFEIEHWEPFYNIYNPQIFILSKDSDPLDPLSLKRAERVITVANNKFEPLPQPHFVLSYKTADINLSEGRTLVLKVMFEKSGRLKNKQ